MVFFIVYHVSHIRNSIVESRLQLIQSYGATYSACGRGSYVLREGRKRECQRKTSSRGMRISSCEDSDQVEIVALVMIIN